MTATPEMTRSLDVTQSDLMRSVFEDFMPTSGDKLRVYKTPNDQVTLWIRHPRPLKWTFSLQSMKPTDLRGWRVQVLFNDEVVAQGVLGRDHTCDMNLFDYISKDTSIKFLPPE